MSETKDLFRKAKAKLAATGSKRKIEKKINLSKKQKVEKQGASLQHVIPTNLQPVLPNVEEVERHQTQDDVRHQLAASGFFDNPEASAPPKVAGEQVKAELDEVDNSSAALKVLPKGFFDDTKKDAKARNEAKEVQDTLRKQHELLLAEIGRDEDKREADNQAAAAAWNKQRDLDECYDLAMTYTRYEELYKNSLNTINAKKEENDQTTQKVKKEESDSDSDGSVDDDVLTGGYTWRTKKVLNLNAEQLRLQKVREQVKQEIKQEADEGVKKEEKLSIDT